MACSLAALAADYLVWFEHLSKFEQYYILAEWYKYASTGEGKKNFYVFPSIKTTSPGEQNDSNNDNPLPSILHPWYFKGNAYW